MRLTEQDFIHAAEVLECEGAAIKAVAEVEAAGYGFLPDGRPKILFEAHIFSRETGGKYDITHPDISSKRWNRFLYKGGAKEYERLEKAKQLDMQAALKSCSWGKFQIMGFNFKRCGYDDVKSFVEDMYKGESYHLIAFTEFIRSNKRLHKALAAKNWESFAKLYNGPAYRLNKYDEKLKSSYQKFKSSDKE